MLSVAFLGSARCRYEDGAIVCRLPTVKASEATFIGYLFGGPDPEHRSVLAQATASRHPGLAVAIAHANFPEQKLVVPAVVLYLIISMVVTSLAPKLMKGRKAQAAAQGR